MGTIKLNLGFTNFINPADASQFDSSYQTFIQRIGSDGRLIPLYTQEEPELQVTQRSHQAPEGQMEFYKFAFDQYKQAGVRDELAKLLAIQDGIESNWGKSKQCKLTQNYSNIHYVSKNENPDEFFQGIDHDANGTRYSTKFRKFKSFQDYAQFKLNLLKRSYRFDNNMSASDFINSLKKWAEAPNYRAAIRDTYSKLSRMI